MSDRKLAHGLLEAAKRDLSALRGMGDASVLAEEIFGFHTRQAVEKAFRAWLVLLDEIYPMTHDLETLLTSLVARDAGAARRGVD